MKRSKALPVTQWHRSAVWFAALVVLLAGVGSGALAQQAPAAGTQPAQPQSSGTQPAAPAPGTAAQPNNAPPVAGAPTTPASGGAPAPAGRAAPRDGAALASGEQLIFPDELAAQVRQQSAEIERLAKATERVRESDSELEALRPEIDALVAATQKMEESLKPRLQTVERQITELGPKPKEGEPAETESIAQERQRVERLRSELQDAIKTSGLTRVRGTQLLSYINQLRLENLGRNLRKRETIPLTREQWTEVSSDMARAGRQFSTIADNWWAILAKRIDWLALILIGSGLLWWSLRRVKKTIIAQRFRMPELDEPPPYLVRVSTAVATLPLIVAPGLLTAGVLYFGLDIAKLFNDQIRELAYAALIAIAVLLLTHAIARVVLLPSNPTWRLIGLSNTTARRYLMFTTVIASIYCFDMWFNAAAKSLHLPISVLITESFVANVAFAVLLFAFAWLPAGSDADRASAKIVRSALKWLRLPATLATLAILVASVLGYLALGRFIAGQVMLIGIGASLFLLGHLAARSLVEPSDWSSSSAKGQAAARGGQLMSLLAFLMNAVLIIIAGAFLLLSWGYSQAELISWGRSLLFGLEIGGFKFSLVQVIVAVVLFVAVLLLTRLVQQWLSKRVFSSENFDRGIANSIHSGIGYLGVALAALVGVSYAGFDLSNLALIAGALSVGIGFGLNAIASNFISGLIMLIERPIKVGDWVVVGAHQGYVRHISVRATEIETFDRASVLIPNSDFMTGAVQNWTHRNALGRIIVNVGVAYDEDPERVLEILKDVVTNCSVLLKFPAPAVFFENFGASSLDFSVRGYIADVNTTMSSATRLRLDIVKAFKEHDIEIPFPQQDIHLRDLDGLKGMLAQAAAERALRAATGQDVETNANGKETADAKVETPLAHGNDNSDDRPSRS